MPKESFKSLNHKSKRVASDINKYVSYFQWSTVNVYLRQQKLHDIKVSKAKMTIEEKETVSLCILSYKNTV